MRKILIAVVGFMLIVNYGCSSDDAKKSSEKTKEVTIETSTATKEAATEATDKAVETGSDAVKETKKKPPIEGC